MAQVNVYLENIIKHYNTSRGAVHAVDNISLNINKGEFLFLLGSSGCGKTTTLRIIAGLVKPDEGSIYIDGQMMNHIPVNKRKIGMVFQNYALFPHMTIFDNIAFGMKLAKVPKEKLKNKVDEMLSLVRLDTGFGDRYPANLSGGQQQRIALARAIGTSPNVLLLDEPFGALDRKLRKEMQVELKELHKKLGITTIFVTHDQEEALTMGDRVAVMHEGKIVQLDTPQCIYERPATRFVADFIGETNMLMGELKEIATDNAVIKVDDKLQICATPLSRDFKVGDKVHVSIRPEKIKIARAKIRDSFNCFEGTISNIVYLGDKTHYFVGLASGQSIKVSRQNDQSDVQREEFREGEKIHVCWDTHNSLMLLD
jgi:spermidine/putrescine transport system ATP-binding protein